MKLTLIAIICCGLLGLGFYINFSEKEKRMNFPNTQSPGSFAILELYTSEGCSSCPSADQLLPELSKLGPHVYPLSFHVDYWNRLGWKDPFSNKTFSDRQREYAEQFRLESVYTPQLIINGKFELVGSNGKGATTAIKKC